MPNTVDITPSPKILRTLGHIPFQPWQCIAELIDNSLDGFRQAGNGLPGIQKRIIVAWSTEAAPTDRTFEIVDNGPGMSPDQLTASVKAGHSNNDPINNLGLFGMGFNIATARLGDKTVVMSAKKTAAQWATIDIDFDQLGDFQAPFDVSAKRVDEHGTKVIVSRLNSGIVAHLRNNEAQVRRQLEEIYTPILSTTDVEILVQGRILRPRPHCNWSAQRFVYRKNERVPAVINIEEVLDDAVFDPARNQYVTPSDEATALRHRAEHDQLPNGLVLRPKRVYGWLGIQRYSDTNEFGIDFIRNGRKILIGDKTLFSFFNPLTGRSELEYPKELGSTLGGRIVGEIHVDHIPPTYQKNDFQRADPSWEEAVAVLRGSGPILPTRRKELGFDGDNGSPLGKLINAYRRADQGTKNLAAPNDKAKEWLKAFRNGDPDYQNDDKWFEAAQEYDRNPQRGRRRPRSSADPGEDSSDDVSQYLGGPGAPPLTTTSAPPTGAPVDPIEELRGRSSRSAAHSGDYAHEGGSAPFVVNVWEVLSGVIGTGDEGEPCTLSKDANVCDFFYNPRHQFLRGYPTTWRDLLLVYLAERFKARDGQNPDLALLFASLFRKNFADAKLDLNSVQERAHDFFDKLREASLNLLAIREREVIDLIHLSAGEVEEIARSLLHNGELLAKFQSRATGAIEALAAVPPRTLVRLVDQFPEEFFDGKFFSTLYSRVQFQDQNMTDRLRQHAKERVIMFLKDALWVISDTASQSAQNVTKEDVARCQHSISSLNSTVVV